MRGPGLLEVFNQQPWQARDEELLDVRALHPQESSLLPAAATAAAAAAPAHWSCSPEDGAAARGGSRASAACRPRRAAAALRCLWLPAFLASAALLAWHRRGAGVISLEAGSGLLGLAAEPGAFAAPYDYCKWRENGQMRSKRCNLGTTCKEIAALGSWLCIPTQLQNPGAPCWEPCGNASGTCSSWCGAGAACCRQGAEDDPPECKGVSSFLTHDYECAVQVTYTPVKHQGQDCWALACGAAGDCSWCGEGNACCRSGAKHDPPECWGVQDFSAKEHHVCVAPVRRVEVLHQGQDCWYMCGSRAGYCDDWCGPGHACCRWGAHADPAECHGLQLQDFRTREHHTCVRPRAPRCQLGYVLESGRCQKATTPQLMQFYVYRVADKDDRYDSNINVGSIAGVMWYLHNEVVIGCPRKNLLSRVRRLKITMRNTERLVNAPPHPQFGPYVEFVGGQCREPLCSQHWDHFGYVVGCQLVAPSAANYTPSPTWYSLPGWSLECGGASVANKTSECREARPGGACDHPNGTKHCTYRVEDAGEVFLDELVGIPSHEDFCAAGGREYDPVADQGRGTCFWDGRQDAARCAKRVQRLQELFKTKYPGSPDLQEPTCDGGR